MPDYSKGKIYTIRCRNDDTLIYVGSTIQPLSKRWGGHKGHSKKHGDRLLYSTIGDNWTDWFIELYEYYPCENKEQLDRREGEITREIETLNKNIAGQTQKEWREDNKDNIKEYNFKYRELNADMIKEYKKEYREQNKEKINQYKKEYRQRKKLEKQAIPN